MTVVLTAVVAALVLAYVAAPLRRGLAVDETGGVTVEAENSRLQALQLRRDALLRDLKDLEFDLRTRKIDDAEYQDLRAETAARASQVLREIETLRAGQVSRVRQKRGESRKVAIETQTAVMPRNVAMEAEIEVLIARARRGLQRESAPQSTLVSTGVHSNGASASWQCSCGRVMSNQDRFCGSCGTPRPD